MGSSDPFWFWLQSAGRPRGSMGWRWWAIWERSARCSLLADRLDWAGQASQMPIYPMLRFRVLCTHIYRGTLFYTHGSRAWRCMDLGWWGSRLS